jgi:hypothetical protein
MQTSEDRMLAMWIVQFIVGIISSISSFLICISYLCNSYLRGYEFRLIFYLCSADLISSILYTIPPHDDVGFCHAQGFLLSFSIVLGLAFTVVIASSIYATHKGNPDRFKQNEKRCLILIFSVALAAAGLPFITGDYSRPLEICWIDIFTVTGSFWRIAIFFGPLWIILIYNSYIYYVMIRNIRSLRSDSLLENGEYIDSAVRKLSLFPAVLVIGWLPASIVMLIYSFSPDYENIYIICVALGFVAGIGFMNALVYGLNSEVREVIGKKLCVRTTDCEFEME